MDTFLIEQPDKTNKIQFLGCFSPNSIVSSGTDVSFNASRYKIVKKQKRQSGKREQGKEKKKDKR